jgi:ubiquitin-protein ligase
MDNSFSIEDLRRMRTLPPPGVQGGPINNDLKNWRAFIYGPNNSPYSGYWFEFRITFPDEYPRRAPSVECHSWILHPNVLSEKGGRVCINTLNRWNGNNPLHIDEVLACIRALMINPVPDGGYCNQATKILKESGRDTFFSEARAYAQRFSRSSLN